MRREFTAKTKKAALKRANGECEKCRQSLVSGRFHFDHDTPDGLSGKPSIENCKVLCLPCHRVKTKADKAIMTKADNVKKRANNLTAPKARIAQPPKAEPRPTKALPPRRPMYEEM
jgi:5-methylcytosine-specific restriction protein A